MPFQSAVVDAVVIKQLPEPDKFKNTHRRSIKIGEDWYSCGSGKSDKFSVKTNDGWSEITKGAKVEFMYDVNGDFKNVQMKTLNLLATGEAPKPTQTAGNAPTRVLTDKDYVNPAKVGMYLNWCKDILQFTKEDFSDDKKLSEAAQWFNELSERATTIYTKVSRGEQAVEDKPKAKKKAAPKPVEEVEEESYEEDFQEDEI